MHIYRERERGKRRGVAEWSRWRFAPPPVTKQETDTDSFDINEKIIRAINENN